MHQLRVHPDNLATFEPIPHSGPAETLVQLVDRSVCVHLYAMTLLLVGLKPRANLSM